MKKLATQTLATLVIVGMMSLSMMNQTAMAYAKSGDTKQLKDLEKLYHYHDRRFELRASVLGIDADVLREQLREKPLETIVKKHGFKDTMAYYTALTGKLKTELRQRGWSERRMETYLKKRLERVTSSFAPMPAAAV